MFACALYLSRFYCIDDQELSIHINHTHPAFFFYTNGWWSHTHTHTFAPHIVRWCAVRLKAFDTDQTQYWLLVQRSNQEWPDGVKGCLTTAALSSGALRGLDLLTEAANLAQHFCIKKQNKRKKSPSPPALPMWLEGAQTPQTAGDLQTSFAVVKK